MLTRDRACRVAIAMLIIACVAAVTAVACSPKGVNDSWFGTPADDASVDASLSSSNVEQGTLPCAVDEILQNHCRACHGATPQFGAPMSLMTFGDLHSPMKSNPSMSVYEGIGARIRNDMAPMPPPPNARLDSSDISTLTTWIAGGAPSATAGCGTGAGEVTSSTPVDAGVVATATDGGYGAMNAVGPSDCTTYFDVQAHGQSTATDDTPYPVKNNTNNMGNTYVCFYVNPKYADGSQGLWFSPILDQTRVLHHWLLYASSSQSQPDGTVMPCQAVEPGWYLLAGWAPGSPATSYPSDVGLQMPSTSGQLILQVHYYDLQNLNVGDRSGVRFCTAPPNTRPHTATVTFTGSEGICIPPDSTNFEVSGNCQPTLDAGDIHVISAWPHMHLLGNRMQIEITRQSGAMETMHDAPFNFNSQSVYPVDFVIHPGDSIQTNCFYDNTTSQKVHFGENTQDEMCYGFLVAWPANALVTDPSHVNAIQSLGMALQQQVRCLNGVSILQSCNGLSDYPTATQH